MGTDGISVHPLIHRWASERLDPAEREKIAIDVMKLGTSWFSFVGGNQFDFVFAHRVQSHFKLFSKHILKYSAALHDCIMNDQDYDAIFDVGYFHRNLREDLLAHQAFKTILEGLEQGNHGGRYNHKIAAIFHAIAVTFHDQGKYNMAVEYYQKAIGPDEEDGHKNNAVPDPNLLNSMGMALLEQGYYDKALEFLERSRKLSRCLPKFDYYVFDSIATVFAKQANYEKASEFYQKALKDAEYHRGSDHVATIEIAHNIGVFLYQQQSYGKAQQTLQRVLAVREEKLGSHHADTLATVNYMAAVLTKLEDFDTAEQLFKRAYDGYESNYGSDYVGALNTVHNMAGLYVQKGDYEKALELYQRALEGREKKLDSEHPDTLETVHEMASVFEKQGDLYKALEWYQRALDGREKRLRSNHPYTLCTIERIVAIRDSRKAKQ